MSIFSSISQTLRGIYNPQNTEESGVFNKYLHALYNYFKGTFAFQQYSNKELLTKGYLDNPTVKYIVDWIADKAVEAIVKTGAYYEIGQDGKETKLEKVPYFDEYIKNPYSFKFAEAIKQYIIFKMVEGEAIAYLKREDETQNNTEEPKKHEEDRIIGWGIFASHDINIQGGGWLNVIESYIHATFRDKFLPHQIYHDRFPNPYFTSNANQLRGLSMLYSAKKIIDIDAEAYKTQGEMFTNRGVNVIISPKNNEGMTDDQFQISRTMFDKTYNGAGKAGSRILAPAPLNVQEIGKSLVDMQIIAREEQSIKTWCNVFRVSSIIFDTGGGGYQSNMETARKMSLEDAVFPRIQDVDSFITHICGSYQGELKKNIIFRSNPRECFSECKDDMKTLTDAVKGMEGASLNQRLNLLGLPLSDDPNADRPLVSKNNIFFDDLEELSMSGGSMPSGTSNTEL